MRLAEELLQAHFSSRPNFQLKSVHIKCIRRLEVFDPDPSLSMEMPWSGLYEGNGKRLSATVMVNLPFFVLLLFPDSVIIKSQRLELLAVEQFPSIKNEGRALHTCLNLRPIVGFKLIPLRQDGYGVCVV
ncbi:hypothetical protein DI53_1937 [Sphingobacterium deserti]|uniref:Uncharacterized protein n=1 Tax=Sphingobacterium deserti TaxID=1229276 RepID=A0A0B8T4A2_9SPHI|nr:hypothetical protein DI53_1937 [Sphingobacterium deserti]